MATAPFPVRSLSISVLAFSDTRIAETETYRFDPMLEITLDSRTEKSISVAEPNMLSSTEPEFDLSRLPSELVNLWDFSGDMGWVSRLASQGLFCSNQKRLTAYADIACHVNKRLYSGSP